MIIKKITTTILAMTIVLIAPMTVYASEMSPLTGDNRETPWAWAIAIIAAIVILVFIAVSSIRSKNKKKRRKRSKRRQDRES